MVETLTFTSRDGRGAAVVDPAHLPILIGTWWGVVDQDVIDGVFDDLEARLRVADAEGSRVVSISWVAQPGMPDALARRRMAERTEALGASLDHVSLGNIVVLESRISRAGLKAVQWMLGSDDDMVVLGTLAEAFEVARDRLALVGQRLESLPDPETYRPQNPLLRVS